MRSLPHRSKISSSPLDAKGGCLSDIVRATRAIMQADSWKEKLIKTRTGAPAALLANAELAICEAPEMRDVLAFNEFSADIFAAKETPWGSTGRWTDNDNTQCAVWLQREHGIHVPTSTAAEAALTVAHKRPFHPVRQYLGGLKWDGTLRIDQWLTLYLGAQ